MPIKIKEPITVPEKKYDKLWASQITIISPKPSEGVSAVIVLKPYAQDGSVLEETTTLFVNDILEKAAANPGGNFAKAMYFLLAAIDEEYLAQ